MLDDYNQKLKTQSKSYKINNFITLKLEENVTFIYITGKRFIQCIRLVLKFPIDESYKYDEIDSIDEAEHIHSPFLNQDFIFGRGRDIGFLGDYYSITPEQEFWGHCSNIEAWAENLYDIRILHRNIAFPLLKELAKAGDKLAQIKLKEEIVDRFLSGYPSVVSYLIEMGYLSYLNLEEFELILDHIGNGSSNLLLIRIFKKLRDERLRTEIYNRLLNTVPIDLYALCDIAQYYMKRYNFNKALNVVTTILKIDESHNLALNLLEKICEKRKVDLSCLFKDRYLFLLMNFEKEQDVLIEKMKTYRRYKSRITHRNKRK